MRILEILTESILDEERGGYLYHGMNEAKALAVFSNDSIPANWQSNLPGIGRVDGNSFSRNKLYGIEWLHGGYLVRLVLDQARLAQTHKMLPVNAERVHRLSTTNYTRRELGNPEYDITDMPRTANDRHKSDSARMDEEFVVGDINNLHRYVVSIDLVNDRHSLQIRPATALALTTFCKKFNIPLTGHPQIQDAVKKAANRAKSHIKKNQLGHMGDLKPGQTVADYYTNNPHPNKDEIAAKWEKYHNNPMDPRAAEDMRQYYLQPEVAARTKAWNDKVAAMKAAGTYE